MLSEAMDHEEPRSGGSSSLVTANKAKPNQTDNPGDIQFPGPMQLKGGVGRESHPGTGKACTLLCLHAGHQAPLALSLSPPSKTQGNKLETSGPVLKVKLSKQTCFVSFTFSLFKQ